MNKLKFTVTIFLLCISTSVFSASWPKVKKVTVATDNSVPPYKMDITYEIGTQSGTLPGNNFHISTTGGGSKGVEQAHFSAVIDLLNDELKANNSGKKNKGKKNNNGKNKQTKIFDVTSFVIYSQTPGDLTKCDMTKYKVKEKRAVDIKVVDGVCSFA